MSLTCLTQQHDTDIPSCVVTADTHDTQEGDLHVEVLTADREAGRCIQCVQSCMDMEHDRGCTADREAEGCTRCVQSCMDMEHDRGCTADREAEDCTRCVQSCMDMEHDRGCTADRDRGQGIRSTKGSVMRHTGQS